MLCDATATVVGSLTGTSTVVSYIESAAGVAAGGRTGVTAIVTGALFAVALFVAPVVGAMVNLGRDDCRIGLCGVTATGMACPTVAGAVFDRFPTALEPDEIDRLLARDVGKPFFGNAFVGAHYRREMAPVVIQRAIAAAARAGQRG